MPGGNQRRGAVTVMRIGGIALQVFLGRRRSAGFTLIELMIVIIIIALLAAIAIPTFLGQRSEAQDAAAYSLVRNGLTVVQSAMVETGSYMALTSAMLHDIENTLTWIESTVDLVAVGGTPGIATGLPADAREKQIVFYRQSPSCIDLASRSDSGNWFGIQVNANDMSETGYIKVKVIDGSASVGW
jgi:prepilin-type N-terminal cleavage/methylation domain-containing protein